ncbi:regulatory protein, luxR family [Sulfitobacter brevis]|uniref:Regulatory protein, luxR family n=1 Tax=Sulfitobacter brevis TaxID=74348 RepID=A0A1I1YJJ3_9RHOB|nr:LuxR C-terminal-related transcriptional regulator [Sulfitobacter brevis]SFE18170.1 regulatory protein, luxR family [Sulfitobacter brevis]
MNKYRKVGLWVIATLQASAAIFYASCALLDAWGIEPQILIWQSHDYQQSVLAIGLLLGVVMGWIAMRMSLKRARIAEEKVRKCATGFSQLIVEHFTAWGLTPAENDVALFLVKGLNTRDIADLRGTSEGTIKAQTNAIYRKAGVAGRSQLLSVFIEDLMDDALLPEAVAQRPTENRPVSVSSSALAA